MKVVNNVQGIGSADTYLVYEPLGTQCHTRLYGSILFASNKEKESKLLLLIHQHVLEQHQTLNRYLRKTSISLWACLFSIRSMGNMSTVLWLLTGRQYVVLKDMIFPRVVFFRLAGILSLILII